MHDERNVSLIDLGQILTNIGDDDKAKNYECAPLNTLDEGGRHLPRCLRNFR